MRLGPLDRIRALDPVIVGLTLGLVVFGLIVLMSASGPVAFQRTSDSLYYVKRQLLAGVLPGLFIFSILALVNYRIWKRLASLALLATFALLLSVYLPGIGVKLGGAQSWISIGGLTFQPSELAKLTFLVYLAAWLAERRGGKAHDFSEGLLPFVATLGAVVFLLIIQPDTGSMAVIAGTAIVLYLVSGAPLVWFGGLAAAGVGIVALLIKYSPYRALRFMTFLHPELDPKGIGYHINQAMLAIGSGGILGLGYGKSRQKFLYLPEVEADSIFAVMAEELGFILIILFLAAFVFLIWRCLLIAKTTKDPFGSYLAAGIGIWLAIQGSINMMSMLGLIPMTGVTLPFVSHGGTSMVALLAAMGLLAGIPRENRVSL